MSILTTELIEAVSADPQVRAQDLMRRGKVNAAKAVLRAEHVPASRMPYTASERLRKVVCSGWVIDPNTKAKHRCSNSTETTEAKPYYCPEHTTNKEETK